MSERTACVGVTAIACQENGGASVAAPLRLVGLPALMDITSGKPETIMALIDGPVALGHPSIETENIRVLPARFGAACSRPDSTACAHGTFVAGVLHAKRGAPAPGICPGCTLLVRPIFSEAPVVGKTDGLPDATPAELATAIFDVIEAGARIINLSAGLAGLCLRDGRDLEQALAHAAVHGVIVVAASGNQGTVGSSTITRHSSVIPVVACDSSGQILPHSNLGASIGRGVVAPGHDITSLSASGGYTTLSGTSVAVPFVAGTIALLWSAFPTASAVEVRRAVTGSSSRHRSVTPALLNARTAYQALASMEHGRRPR